MSGGSWGYVYAPLAAVIDALKNDTTTTSQVPLELKDDQRVARTRLAWHLEKISTALRAICTGSPSLLEG